MPSVMQKIVAIPAVAASMTASGAPAAGTKMHDVLAPVSRTASATVSKTGTRPSSAVLPALAGRHAGDDRGAVFEHRPGVELALAAGDALDDEARVAPDEDAHAAAPAPRPASTALAAASSSEAAVSKRAPRQELRRLLRVRPDDPDDHRHVARLLRACLDQPARDLVAAGDPAEDVDEDRVDLRVGEDEPHRRRDLVGPRAAADVEEVRGLAAGALHEVHRRHREAGAVDHAADRAVELDERQARRPRLAIGRVLLVQVAQRLELGVARQRGVVERDLRVEADEPLDRRAVGARLADDRERVDLDEVGVVGVHRPDETLGDPDGSLEVRAEAHRERELARLAVEQAERAGRRGS